MIVFKTDKIIEYDVTRGFSLKNVLWNIVEGKTLRWLGFMPVQSVTPLLPCRLQLFKIFLILEVQGSKFRHLIIDVHDLYSILLKGQQMLKIFNMSSLEARDFLSLTKETVK